jgi:hypothetical protein
VLALRNDECGIVAVRSPGQREPGSGGRLAPAASCGKEESGALPLDQGCVQEQSAFGLERTHEDGQDPPYQMIHALRASGNPGERESWVLEDRIGRRHRDGGRLGNADDAVSLLLIDRS